MKQKFLNSFYALFLFTGIVQAQEVTSDKDDGLPGTLRQVIANAAEGATITFKDDVKHIILTKEIEIKKSLTITGDGAANTKIDGAAKGRIFRVNSNINVSIESITITNGLANYGGGILNYGNLTLTNTVISNNQVTGSSVANGGGIFNSSIGTLIIHSATFTGNKAIGFISQGGAIYNEGTRLSITASRIEDNECSGGGNGGGIYHSAKANTVLEMTDVIVKNNRIIPQANTSGLGGGGLSIKETGGSVTITNGSFQENSAGPGGGLRNESVITISGTIFDKNSSLEGGAIYNERGTINLTNAAIRNNEGGSGGGIYSYLGNLNITNTAINSNTAKDSGGGGIFASGASLVLNNCDLKDNTSTGTDGNASGGGLKIYGGSLSMTGGNIAGNTTQYDGGGIYLGGTITATFDKVNVASNTANNGGGGLYTPYDSTSSLTITNSVFANNVAVGTISGGGGLYLSGDVLVNISTSTISGNTVKNNASSYNNGGGIFSNCKLTINASTIVNNSAPKKGGGIYNEDSNNPTVTLKNTIVAKNNAAVGRDVYNTASNNFVSTGYNLIGQDDDTAFTATTGDLVGTTAAPIDPKIELLTNSDGSTRIYKLLKGSPAFNTGNPADMFPDQIGQAVFGEPIKRRDIGAYEAQEDLLGNPVFDLKNNNSTVWPNPSNGTIKINLSNRLGSTAKGSLIEIASGKTVRTFAVNGNSEINLQHYAAGLYIVRLESESVTENHKLIIQ